MRASQLARLIVTAPNQSSLFIVAYRLTDHDVDGANFGNNKAETDPLCHESWAHSPAQPWNTVSGTRREAPPADYLTDVLGDVLVAIPFTGLVQVLLQLFHHVHVDIESSVVDILDGARAGTLMVLQILAVPTAGRLEG